MKKARALFGLLASLLAITLFLGAVFGVKFAHAQTSSENIPIDRKYVYDTIKYLINVNEDSTFDVEETQTYVFTGEYHAAERVIPYNKISDITEVVVLDGVTNEPLEYSSRTLEKSDQRNWGKYTVFNSGGALHVVWYYNKANTDHSWIIRYKVHGGIAFHKDHDELYWNLFSEYTVPVLNVKAVVTIPENNFESSSLAQSVYTRPNAVAHAEGKVIDNRTFEFSAQGVTAFEPFTIAAGWPKGLISKSAFWFDFLKVHAALILSILIGLATLVILIIRWYMTERYHMGKGTIIAEYDPPKRNGIEMRPAMVDVVVREGLSSKTWAATVVDLAVRGYVAIKEDDRKSWVTKMFPSLAKQPKQYIVTKEREYMNDQILLPYEKEFLGILFYLSPTFSTRDMGYADTTTKREMYKDMQKLKETVYDELDDDTKLYVVGLDKKKYLAFIPAGIFALILLAASSGMFSGGRVGLLLPLATILASLVTITIFFKFNPRLTQEGAILKDDIRGFKLYLATAEKYRMQNLTPETFEKYLPYAIVFGVEKKWARAFEGINVPQPGWYSSAGYAGGSNFSSGGASGLTSGFSASAFSASFGSSFASAFSSSAGGGASGGGGSAGGGGGGGGGGAS